MILFNSSRPLGRCENLTAVWDAYDGPKRFSQGGYGDVSGFADCDVVVTDEFVRRKRPGQAVVLIDHAIAGGKCYGLDQPHGVYEPEACGLVDWYVASSEGTRAFCASAAGIPLDRVLPLGAPRTDAYAGKRKGDGHTFLAKFPRAYLLAPTFRASWEPRAPGIDWERVDGQLEDDEVLVVKRHMVTKGRMTRSRYAHIAEVNSDEPSAPYLVDCDVVITDYSSIVLDGYVLGKPSVLFAPEGDLAAYETARGFYMEYPGEYGHVRCKSSGSLVLSARIAALEGMNAVERACLERTAGACDGHSIERVIDLVRSLA